MLPMKISGVKRSERKQRALAALEQLEMADKAGNKAVNLSGGQKQRSVIARALVNNPRIIFADEPTGALDTHSSTEILGLLRTATSQWNQTVAMVTHDPVAATFADRVVFLADGEIVDELFEPTVDAILAQMKGMR